MCKYCYDFSYASAKNVVEFSSKCLVFKETSLKNFSRIMEYKSEKSPVKQQLVVQVKKPEMDAVFEVEEILKKRRRKNKEEYFVKWKGLQFHKLFARL